MDKVYIVGAVTGVKNWQKKFRQAVLDHRFKRGDNLKDEIITPVAYPEGKTQKEYMVLSCESVFWADRIVVTAGWENSKGTRAEIALAESFGLPIEYLPGAGS